MESLVRLYRKRITGYVLAFIGQDEAIEDVCQTICLKMLAGLKSLESPDSFESWLRRIARNACYDSLRERRLVRLFVSLESTNEMLEESLPSNDEATEVLRSAFKKMPKTQQELLVLLAQRDWSYEELAQLTGTSVSSVRSRLFRARKYLRKTLRL
ncbi:MAG: RNA polymerase sigma factor [Candidatus Binataceae bacterium]